MQTPKLNWLTCYQDQSIECVCISFCTLGKDRYSSLLLRAVGKNNRLDRVLCP